MCPCASGAGVPHGTEPPPTTVAVFEIAERFLADVGDTTYQHLARRLAELQRKSAAPRDPGRALRVYQRLLPATPAEGRSALVLEAVGEFTRRAAEAMEAGDAEGALEWVAREDLHAWLWEPAVRHLWQPKEVEWYQVTPVQALGKSPPLPPCTPPRGDLL